MGRAITVIIITRRNATVGIVRLKALECMSDIRRFHVDEVIMRLPEH
jgi:hypothetical protein